MNEGPSVALIAAMVPEIVPAVRRLGLRRAAHPVARVYVGQHEGIEIVAAVTSMGTEAATRVTRALLEALAVDHVIVVGIAGGIAADLALGDLVCPEVAVLDGTDREARATALGPVQPRGAILTTDELYTDPGVVDGLRERGLLAVDMETAAIGLAAESRGVPWTAFRAISDFAGDPAVDDAVVGLSHPDGTANRAAIARFLWTKPHRIPQLLTLGRGMRRAIRASTDAAIDALDALAGIHERGGGSD